MQMAHNAATWSLVVVTVVAVGVEIWKLYAKRRQRPERSDGQP